MIQNNVKGMSYLPNMHSKVSINVVSVDANVILIYTKPLMNVHKVQIINLGDLHVGGKSIGTVMHHKNGSSYLLFLGSVIMPNVVGAILL